MTFKSLVQICLEMWGAVICLIFLTVIFFRKGHTKRRGKLLSLTLAQMVLLLVCDCIALYTRGKLSVSAYILVRLSNFLVFLLNYCIGYTNIVYMEDILKNNGHRMNPLLKHSVSVVCAVGAGMVIISQFNGFLYTIGSDNLYRRGPGFAVISLVGGLMVILITASVLINFKKMQRSQAFSWLTLYLLVILANAIQIFYYGISFVNIAVVIGMVFMFISYEKDMILYSAMQENANIRNQLLLAEKERELAVKEADIASMNTQLAQEHTQLVLSQIQPHFLYNALSAIGFLCTKDPKKARYAVDNLSSYLRTNLDSLVSVRLVSFSRELEHTEAYLAIEKLRFGDDLNIEYDINCDEFMLPTLSLQPMVENSVRHGVCKKEEGGTVTIRTEKTDSEYLISVIDDGVGFNPDESSEDNRAHIGVENVRKRIKLLCDGELIIKSVPDKGTEAVIHIPIKE
ncbi:MAG: histidine kinase [Clostridia bacterium]|nr:histidine kinase [Clostridia bacterium]